jgi:hypothetical protein
MKSNDSDTEHESYRCCAEHWPDPCDERKGLLTEDRSDIKIVPDAVREMWDPNSRRNRKVRER